MNNVGCKGSCGLIKLDYSHNPPSRYSFSIHETADEHNILHIYKINIIELHCLAIVQIEDW